MIWCIALAVICILKKFQKNYNTKLESISNIIGENNKTGEQLFLEIKLITLLNIIEKRYRGWGKN